MIILSIFLLVVRSQQSCFGASQSECRYSWLYPSNIGNTMHAYTLHTLYHLKDYHVMVRKTSKLFKCYQTLLHAYSHMGVWVWKCSQRQGGKYASTVVHDYIIPFVHAHVQYTTWMCPHCKDSILALQLYTINISNHNCKDSILALQLYTINISNHNIWQVLISTLSETYSRTKILQTYETAWCSLKFHNIDPEVHIIYCSHNIISILIFLCF